MNSSRAARGALARGRKKLQAATRGVDELVKDVTGGRSALCRTPAEGALKRREFVVQYNALTRSLKEAAAALRRAESALESLDAKIATPPSDADGAPGSPRRGARRRTAPGRR